MARNRMIRPEFWEDEKIGTLCFAERLMFIAIWNLADDSGFVRWNEHYLLASIFPYDKISIKKIKMFMKNLENKKFIEVFETKSNFFVAKIKNWQKHQKINKPQESRFEKDLKSEVLKNQQESDVNSCNDSCNDSNTNSTPKEVKEKEKLKEIEVKEKIKEKGIAKSPATLSEHQKVFNIFSEKYKSLTKQNYKSDKKDFILLADLCKKASFEQIAEKIDIFERACKISAVSEKSIFWFAKEGLSCFTIGNFIKNYNAITPFLTDKEKEEQKRKILDEQRRQRVEEHLKKQGAM